MASVRATANGKFEISYYLGKDSSGKPIRPTETYEPDMTLSPTKREKAARAYANKREEELKNGRILKSNEAELAAKARKMTLADLGAEYFPAVSPYEKGDPDYKIEKTTYESYKRTFDHRIKPIIGHVLMRQINSNILSQYSSMLREDGIRLDKRNGCLSEGTIKKDIAIISAMLTFAVLKGYLPINPLIYSGKKKKRKRKTEYKVTNMSVDEVKRFFWALDNPIPVKHQAHASKAPSGTQFMVKEYSQEWKLELKWRFFFYLATFIGCRRGEIVSFTWEDLNFKTGEVNIDKSTAHAKNETYLKDTKGHSSRSAIVPLFVMELGKELLKEQKKQALSLGDYWVGYHGIEFSRNFVFTQENGRQMDLGSPRRQFKRIIRIYNENVAKNESEYINPNVTLHSLRHTAAAILISGNMDPRSVADILGHADPTTTLNIYAYFFRSKHSEAAKIMENALAN